MLSIEIKVFIFWLVIVIGLYILDFIRKSLYRGCLSDYGWEQYSWSYAIKKIVLQLGLFVLIARIFFLITIWWFKL